ncbi:MAG: PAS domain S-box protein [Pseudomonadota bacterium]|nr:PAS domain S-box protein [Pseudomonadota bacterium]
MGTINWDQQGILSDHISDSHPFKAVFDAIAIIKGDVDDFLDERLQAEETLRASEEKYRTILESIEQGYYEYDLAGNFTFFNDAMCKIFGYSRDELMGMNNRQYMDKENAARAYKTFNKVYRTGEPEKGLICEFIRKDGVKRQIGFSISLMKDNRGRRIGFRGIASDITERRILQEQLAQAQKLESIGQLASGIAHEINTPTQYVSDNIHFLRDSFDEITNVLEKYDKLFQAIKTGEVPKDLVREVEIARSESDMDYLLRDIPLAIQQSIEGVNRTAGIVRAMKEFSHPGTTRKAPVDINAAIQSTISVARNEWKYVAAMKTDFDSTLTAVPCLAGEFNQVILNLIINACHAIAAAAGDGSGEKGTIRVCTRRDGHWAEIRVSDTGTGMPESIRTRIFDPFFTTKEVGKGTGQGLALSHAVIVKKHSGTIRFETEIGKGTTFIIRLPLDDAPEIKAETQDDEMDLLFQAV